MTLDGDPGDAGPYPYLLFAIYAAGDALWVNGHLLPALGIPRSRVITEEQFEPGRFTAEEVERAVRMSRHTLLVLSPEAIAGQSWMRYARVLAVHAEIAQRHDRLIPLILRPCEPPDGIAAREAIDFTDPSTWDQRAAELREWLDQPPPAREDIPCPYPGMRPYSADDASHFFARDQEIETCLQAVRRLPSLYVIGPSGSGKSSLVFAGLIPELHRREPGRWMVRPMRPGPKPVEELAKALGSHPEALGEDPRLAGAVRSLLAGDGTASKLLLVVDQLEEVFTLSEAWQRDAFLDALARLREVPDCVVVSTFRADFYPELMISVLWRAAAGERCEIVPPRGDALRHVIELPASQVGVYLEGGLVERLVADAAGEPGVLPLVQETLVQLWERRQHRLLTLAAYESLGRDGESGLAVALARTADACMAKLSPDQRDLARRIFLRLVQLGEGRDDTRRQQSVDELRAAGEDRDMFRRTLRQLADDRLLILDGQPGIGSSTVDICHEALLKSWPELRGWLAQGRADELQRRGIENDAKYWSKNRWDRSGLYRPRRLKNAMDWRRRHPYDVSPQVLAFLTASRRLNIAVRTFRVVALASIFLGLAALAVPQAQAYLWRQQARALNPMASFPSGPAVLGSGRQGSWAQRTVSLAAFSLDIYEVSNQQYRLCVQAHACTAPLETGDAPSYLDADPRHPVVFVTARQSAEFCRWLGRRLPSAAEWERAARGTNGRAWPWGNEAISTARANVQTETSIPNGLVAVDAKEFSGGASPEGVIHLVGNVQERTATPSECKPNPYQCARLWNGWEKVKSLDARGQGFQEPGIPLDEPNEFRAKATDPNFGDADIGLRCAKSNG
jgi:formylglycine-generating enzyme required for sulfatase activity